LCLQRLKHRRAIGRDGHRMAMLLKESGEQRQNILFIVDHQDVWH
jgi:hypothetical protein